MRPERLQLAVWEPLVVPTQVSGRTVEPEVPVAAPRSQEAWVRPEAWKRKVEQEASNQEVWAEPKGEQLVLPQRPVWEEGLPSRFRVGWLQWVSHPAAGAGQFLRFPF